MSIIGRKYPLYVVILLLILSFNSWASRIQYGELGVATTLDPITSTDMVSRRLCELIYSGLLDFDEKYDPIWRLSTGELSEKNQVEYTFGLREAIWHDGITLSPEDIIFTVDAMRAAPDKRSRVSSIHEVQRAGDKKVRFILKNPTLNVKGLLVFKIIPKHIAQSIPITINNPIVKKPIGLGPYKFIKREGNGVISLERNERYFDQENQPRIDGIEMRPCATDDVIYNSLIYGAINVAVSLHSRYAHEIGKGFNSEDSNQPVEPLATEPYNSLSYQYFALNIGHDSVGSRFLSGDGDKDVGVKVRQALNYGTNRREWLKRIMYEGGNLISGPFAPGSPYYNVDVKPYVYDLEMANRFLDEAGYVDSDGDNYRENSNGETIVLRALKRQKGREENRIWQAFESDMRRLGIKVEAQVLDAKAWKKKVYYDHDFDLVFDSWYFASAGDIYSLFHSSQNQPGGDNYVSYSNGRIDMLLDKASNIMDAKQLQDINRMLHALIKQDCPYIFLWSPNKYAGRVRRLRNFKIHPFAFFTYVTDWYFDE